ncbi:hypothetical protein TeGR_g15068 [Tetraparma gracilis]|uniref:Uncharacterized protein n=1 Tax=Tetraparma gracilis TaxID=2962635 RepID=A0ABQ6MQ09_9STRA|nr:hypothetical protein TeGR_g15068 [Tetraparma gracilis]
MPSSPASSLPSSSPPSPPRPTSSLPSSSRRQASLALASLLGGLGGSPLGCSALTQLESSPDGSSLFYVPSRSMIGDASGSAQTRGLQQSGAGKGEAGKQPKLSSKALARLTFQVFPPRFVCYLSRFLLTFDSNSRAYWEANSKTPSQALTTFAEFADSVLVGLTDYFVGSYSSERTSSSLDDKKLKNGVLNLLALLKARYTRSVEKRQLSILFAFIPSKFQPIAEITSLLGETDDGSVITLNIQPFVYQLRYSSDLPPNIYISSPPALGNAYSVAKARAVMVDTGRRIAGQTAREQRVSKVVLDNGGNGYTSAVNLNVFISPPGRGRPVLCGSGVVRASQANAAELLRVTADEGPPYPLDLTKIRTKLTQLLPSGVRPYRLEGKNATQSYFAIPLLPAAPPSFQSGSDPNYSSFKFYDPVFGPIGKAPVTKLASNLGSAEYARLALAGGICTVIVRTGLNPLELAKTKVMLGQSSPSPASDFVLPEGAEADAPAPAVTTNEMLRKLVADGGVGALFQSSDITFLSSIIFGSFGFGTTEIFRRSFAILFNDVSSNGYSALLWAAAAATAVTSLVAAPFEYLRVRSMSLPTPAPVSFVLASCLRERGTFDQPGLSKYFPLYSSFWPIFFRELPFALGKFGAYEVLIKTFDSTIGEMYGIRVGVGGSGLVLSALCGAVAGVVGAAISHPADLVLTLQSSQRDGEDKKDWVQTVKQITDDGGVANLFLLGLTTRAVFFFFVIGLQFLLYDYAKDLLNVGSNDFQLVLDVFYSIRSELNN